MTKNFEDGKQKVEDWFKAFTENPIVKAISDFFSPIIEEIKKFFATEKDENGNDVTWWDRVTANFEQGKKTIEDWFKAFTENPVVVAITGFFKPIIDEVAKFFSPKDTETSEKTMWYARLLEKFRIGRDVVDRWFNKYIKENPVVKAIGDFFAPIIEEIGKFFSTSTNDQGEEETWWDKLKNHFEDGKAKVISWFDSSPAKPIIQAITDFFRPIINRVKTFFIETTDQNGDPVSWWDKIQAYFGNGILMVKKWFDDLKGNNPVIAAISAFFTSVGTAIKDTVGKGFAPYEKVIVQELGDSLTETTTIKLPWYQRFIDIFNDGIGQIGKWFDDLKATNPIVSSVTAFFENTWTNISSLFSGNETGKIDLKKGITTTLTGVAERLDKSVERLRKTNDKSEPVIKQGQSFIEKTIGSFLDLFVSGGASAEGNVLEAVEQYGTAFTSAEEKVADTVKSNSDGPVTILGLVGKVFSLMFEGFMLMWQNLSDVVSKMKFDSLWAFLDKIVHYWNAFSFGNLAVGVRNLTTMASYHQRAELLEKLSGVFLSLATLAGVIVGFATLDEDKTTRGFIFLGGLMLGIIGLLGVTALLSKKGAKESDVAKASDMLTTVTGTLGATLGSTAFIGSLAAIVAAVSGAIKDIAGMISEGVTEDDITSALKFLAIGLAGVWAFSLLFSGGMSFLSKIAGQFFSKAGLNFSFGSKDAGAGTGEGLEKFLNLSITGLEGIASIVSVATALKAFTGALKEIDELMKENNWESIQDASKQIDFLLGIICAVVAALTLDRLSERAVNSLFKNKDQITEDTTKSIKDSIAETLKSAADILAIAQAVKMLVEAMEPIVRMRNTYGEDEVNASIKSVEGILQAVLLVEGIDKFVTAFTDKIGGENASGENGTKGNLLAAAISQPIIAISGAVWILVQALGSLIDISKKLPDDKDIDYYMGRLALILTAVLGSEAITNLIDMMPTKGNFNSIVSVVSLLLGIAGVIGAIIWVESLMGSDKQRFIDAGNAIGEILLAVLGSTAVIEALATAADRIPPKGLLVLAGIGAVIAAIAFGGASFTSSIGDSFTQIAQGVQSIVDTVNNIEDVSKLEALGNAIGNLALANSMMSGSTLSFLDALFKKWFDVGTGETLENLGEYTEGFSEHIPNIVRNLQSVGDSIQVFGDFVRLIEMVTGLLFLSYELDGAKDFASFGTNFETATGGLSRAVENLAEKSGSYEAAMLGIWFLQELAQIAKSFNIDGIGAGIDQLTNGANILAASDLPQMLSILAGQFMQGFTENDERLIAQLSSLMTTLVNAIRGKYSEFAGAGRYIASGLAFGMKNGESLTGVYQAGYNLAREALAGINSGAKVQSPSKEAYASGEFIVAGLANAMRDESYIAYREGMDLATASLDGMRSVLSDNLASSIEDDFLTIRPVMDMSDIQNGMDTIDAYTHGYREFNFGGWKSQNSQLQNGSFGGYSTIQASRIGNADINAYIPYDDYRVVASLNGLNAKMDSIDQLVDKIDNLQIVLDSGVLVGGIANKMNRRLGVIATREERRS